jgi:adenine-specific DNA glycosylase
MKPIPPKEWANFSHRLIAHGRTICIARKPKCAECALNDLYPSGRSRRSSALGRSNISGSQPSEVRTLVGGADS